MGDFFFHLYDSVYFGHMTQRVNSLEKTLMLGGIGAGGEGGDGGRDGWVASPTPWTRVWVNSRRWWRTRKPAVLHSMGPQRVGHDLATERWQVFYVWPTFSTPSVGCFYIQPAIIVFWSKEQGGRWRKMSLKSHQRPRSALSLLHTGSCVTVMGHQVHKDGSPGAGSPPQVQRRKEKGATEDEIGWNHHLNGHESEQTEGLSLRSKGSQTI